MAQVLQRYGGLVGVEIKRSVGGIGVVYGADGMIDEFGVVPGVEEVTDGLGLVIELVSI